VATIDRKVPQRGFTTTKGTGSPRIVPRLLLISVLQLAASFNTAAVQDKAPVREPDVVYVPTPPRVVAGMLKAAEVTSKDVLYDLGCGDGRIVIEAAKTYGTRGVGIDIDPERIAEAEANARKQGVADLVDFHIKDLFEAEIGEASVVTLYLLPELNLKLRPKLWKDLAVGTRVVSHGYDMGVWKPEKIIWIKEHPIYVWTITEETKRRTIP
jgi:SAM-dependent methyltransferase